MIMHTVSTARHACATAECVAEPGDLACVVDVAALLVVDPAPDREPVVLITAVQADGERFVDIDVDARSARVRLDDLLQAVAAAGAIGR